ncbi:MAG: hypothetical protein COT71_03610 [Candidatus Andersenbacteria bacterium CG10_big_fil_rev_8_21_14_0_10_54_11]|uniref:ROK family protein n=1 Tax=Candidatus Andersenbacteria bacterium CG10_big_fil_rev_8_21_14_0_10_54_11 TaxID=1974485 RepID=A0A2M6WYR2_9BACT|nr:MAG: hypothetical protein COT71_03610 [Candidatus Andersenbacteria bacterium CG10_big_fil_rev_8_21_14_0_10_54_11]
MDLLIDIGGTNTRMAVSRNGGLSEPHEFPTAPDAAQAIQTITAAARRLTSSPITRVAAALPGLLASDRASLTWSPNLPAWQGHPLAARLRNQLHAPVTLHNDADFAGLGEALYGAGRGYRIVAYFTISTGIGGSRIIDGRIDDAAGGLEPGHQILDLDGTLYPEEAAPATLEGLIGGASTERRFRQPPKNIRDPAVWETYARQLAAGLKNAICFWSPHIIIIGGPMMRDIKLAATVRHLRTLIAPAIPLPPILPAALADNIRALRGAAVYLEHR